MAEPGPIPVFPQGPNDGPAYEYHAWPAYRVSPEGKRMVFNNPEEVPEGWMTTDEFAEMKAAELDIEDDDKGEGDGGEGGGEKQPVVPSGEEKPRELTADQKKAAIAKLIDGNTQADLVTMLELMNEQRAEEDAEEIEFSTSWPKPKLAEAIVDNGGPLDAEEAE